MNRNATFHYFCIVKKQFQLIRKLSRGYSFRQATARMTLLVLGFLVAAVR